MWLRNRFRSLVDTKMGAGLVKYNGKKYYHAPIADGSTSPIMELNIDGLEEIFEYLSLDELLSFRQTCKRFKKAVNHYIKTYYPAIRRITITDKNITKLLRFTFDNSVDLISEIIFNLDKRIVTRAHIAGIKGILSQVEIIKVIKLEFEGDFYEYFLKFCPNLKELYILCCDVLNMGTGNEWLLRRYPTLRVVHFEDINDGRTEIMEMKTFFNSNPNIQTLFFDMNSFLKYANLLCDDNININHLRLAIGSDSESKLEHFFELLSEFQEQSERLHLGGTSANTLIYLNWFIPNLKNLDLNYMFNTFPMLPDLREFKFLSGFPLYIYNVEVGARSIEHIGIEGVGFDDLLPLIRKFRKIEWIFIMNLKTGTYFHKNIIDLPAINKERQQLKGACKIKLLVEHKIFFATKLAMKTNFSLIELKPYK